MSPTAKSSRSGPSPCTIAGHTCATSAVAIRDQRSGSTRAMIRHPPSPRLAALALPFDAAPPPSLETTDTPTGDVARHE